MKNIIITFYILGICTFNIMAQNLTTNFELERYRNINDVSIIDPSFNTYFVPKYNSRVDLVLHYSSVNNIYPSNNVLTPRTFKLSLPNTHILAPILDTNNVLTPNIPLFTAVGADVELYSFGLNMITNEYDIIFHITSVIVGVDSLPTFINSITIPMYVANTEMDFTAVTLTASFFDVSNFVTNFITTVGAEPLPLKLLFFNARAEGHLVSKLEWLTAEEKEMLGFDIERSINSIEFESIDFVKAQMKASNQTNSYQYTDPHAKEGKNYYRLKIWNEDKSFRYSPIREVLHGVDNYIKIYPNPSTDIINIKNLQPGCNITITDNSGKIIQSISSPQKHLVIPVDHYTPGIYFISIGLDDIQFTKEKIIINK
jgi:hypothetical protein